MQRVGTTSEKAIKETRKMLKGRNLQIDSNGLNSDAVVKLAGILFIPCERETPILAVRSRNSALQSLKL